MGGCQNYGPFLGTLTIRCRTIIGTQKGTIILATTHIIILCVCVCVRVGAPETGGLFSLVPTIITSASTILRICNGDPSS